MPQTLSFSVSRTVAASADRVWQVLGDFGTEHRWSKGLRHCHRTTEAVAVGTARICELPRPLMGRTRVREELTEYVDGASLAYELDGAAGPFATAGSRWSVDAVDANRSTVTVRGQFTPQSPLVLLLWPLLRFFVARLSRESIGELEDYVVGGARRLPG